MPRWPSRWAPCGRWGSSLCPAMECWLIATAPPDRNWCGSTGKASLSGALGPPVNYSSGPTLSPDGNRVAVDQTDPTTGRRDIWVLDAAGVDSRSLLATAAAGGYRRVIGYVALNSNRYSV